MGKHVVAAAVLCAFAASAPAQLSGVYTINPMQPASGTNYQTLGAATSALAASGVSGPVTFEVYDDGGDYTETATMPITTWSPATAVLTFAQWTGVSSTNRVTFTAAAGESPVLDATGRGMGVCWGGADYVTLDHFEIKNPIFDAITLYSSSGTGSVIDAIISNCVIHDVPGAAVVIYGNTPSPTNTLVANNVFYRCCMNPSGGFADITRHTYIGSRRDVGTRVVHNTFYGDAFSATSSYRLGFLGNSQTSPGTPWAECSNNVFLRVSASSGFFTTSFSSTVVPTVMDGNCFHDTTGGNFANINGTIIADLAAWQAAYSLDASSITSDPLLVDPATMRDFHLQGGSPCVNGGVTLAGVSAAAVTATDFEGDMRDAMPDIGADESSSASLEVATTAAQVAPGETLVPVTVTITNGSLTDSLDLATVDLTFTGTVDRTSEYTVVPDPANPTMVASGGMELLQFWVDVASMASEETITIDAGLTGTYMPSGSSVAIGSATTTATWDVIGARPVARLVDAPSPTAGAGSSGNIVDVTIENVGLTAWQPGAITLSFFGTADRTSEYTVMPDPANPTMIAPGTTEILRLLVSVSLMATIETVTIDVASADGTDLVTGRAQADSGADVTDTWMLVTCFAPLCGDCSGDLTVSIVDALIGAQHSAGIIFLTGIDFTNCNVIGLLEPDPGAAVDIIDALTLAQWAAGLPVPLTCC